MKRFWPKDVIDVHLIGHSRGGSVISQAIGLLQDNAEVTRGTLRMTMLDPHPASNVAGRTHYDFFGLAGLAAEQAVLGFQAVANDPDPIVHENVDYADHLYQKTLAIDARPGSGERVLNLWGDVPVENRTPFAINAVDLTGPGMSHGAVITWFMQSMLPLLGRGLA